LGRSPVSVSPLGVGAMTWGEKTRLTPYGGTRSRADEEGAFQASRASGVTLFDTAEFYSAGNSERRLGELARETDAVIATKYSPARLLPPRFPHLARRVPKALDASLGRLGRTTIDLYQIHYPQPGVSIKALMGRLADAVAAGKTLAVGVSNYSEDQMRTAYAALEARGVPLASNQVQFSLLYRRPEFDGVLAACRELNVTLLAYMPLASGALSGKYRPDNLPTDWMRRRGYFGPFGPREMESTVPVVQKLAGIGQAHGKSVAQVALRWVMEQGGVPIPGATNGSQASENAGAMTFSLSTADVNELNAAAKSWVQTPKWKSSARVS